MNLRPLAFIQQNRVQIAPFYGTPVASPEDEEFDKAAEESKQCYEEEQRRFEEEMEREF